LSNRQPTRLRTRIVLAALSLGLLAAALLGPSQTLAQTRKAACSTVHAKAKRACAQSSHKGRHKRKTHRAGKGNAKHALAKTKSKGGSSSPVVLAPATCENGSAPVRSGGSFSCEDGSEPACEDGAAPTTSRNGKSLLCPAPAEPETSSGAGSGEGECEEEEALSCTPVTGSGSSEHVCETSPSAGSSFVCEGEA
jgi:hypothetical protein